MRPWFVPAYRATEQNVNALNCALGKVIPADVPPFTAGIVFVFPLPVALVTNVGEPRVSVVLRPFPELSAQIFVVAL